MALNKQKILIFNCMTNFVDYKCYYYFYTNIGEISTFIVKNLIRFF
jgi:hypothetical protein